MARLKRKRVARNEFYHEEHKRKHRQYRKYSHLHEYYKMPNIVCKNYTKYQQRKSETQKLVEKNIYTKPVDVYPLSIKFEKLTHGIIKMFNN